MGVVSDQRAAEVGVPASSPAWSTVHAELLEYLQRVLGGLKTKQEGLSRGLDVPESVVGELLAGRAGGLDVDGLLRLLAQLELPIRLERQDNGSIQVAFGSVDFTLT